MPFVIDASIVACWAFRDEQSRQAEVASTRLESDDAVVPGLWWFEVRNVLIAAERRRLIAENETFGFLRYLGQMPIRLDWAPDEANVLRLARSHKLTVYDAAYLDLAIRERIPLATLDGALVSAARAEGVGLLGESS